MMNKNLSASSQGLSAKSQTSSAKAKSTIRSRIVIKLGGSALDNPATLLELAQLIKSYQKKRYKVVVVHGGGPAINQELTRRNITWQFIDGQRQTTPEMMTVIDEVLAKTVNTKIVESLRAAGIRATGLSGADHNILHCERLNAQLMQVGSVTQVNTQSIEACFQTVPGTVPVIAPIGLSNLSSTGRSVSAPATTIEKFNINADWAATKIATALQAKRLVFLTDQTGILDQDKNLLKRLNSPMVQKLIDCGVIAGGMCTKARAMMSALENGVGQVRVLNAINASQLISAALNDERLGTLLTDSTMSPSQVAGLSTQLSLLNYGEARHVRTS